MVRRRSTITVGWLRPIRLQGFCRHLFLWSSRSTLALGHYFHAPRGCVILSQKKIVACGFADCHCLSRIIVTDVSGRAGLQARVKGLSRRMEPRRGGTGNKCGCVAPTALGFLGAVSTLASHPDSRKSGANWGPG